jgi:hypothetical protein
MSQTDRRRRQAAREGSDRAPRPYGRMIVTDSVGPTPIPRRRSNARVTVDSQWRQCAAHPARRSRDQHRAARRADGLAAGVVMRRSAPIHVRRVVGRAARLEPAEVYVSRGHATARRERRPGEGRRVAPRPAGGTREPSLKDPISCLAWSEEPTSIVGSAVFATTAHRSGKGQSHACRAVDRHHG